MMMGRLEVEGGRSLQVEADRNQPAVNPLVVHHRHRTFSIPLGAKPAHSVKSLLTRLRLPDHPGAAVLHLGKLDIAGMGEAVLESVPGAVLGEAFHHNLVTARLKSTSTTTLLST